MKKKERKKLKQFRASVIEKLDGGQTVSPTRSSHHVSANDQRLSLIERVTWLLDNDSRTKKGKK